MDEKQIRGVCSQLHIHVDNTMGKGKMIDEIFGDKCEDYFVQPTFIIDYPVEMSPLTKKHRSKPGLVERFELLVNGKEIANAYSELNDPVDQRERFEEQVKLMERGDTEAMFIDYDFLRALEYGMPPTSGIGFGIDRICMLLLNQPSIQDVLLFPMMRPEKREEELEIDYEEKIKEYVKRYKNEPLQKILAAKIFPFLADSKQLTGIVFYYQEFHLFKTFETKEPELAMKLSMNFSKRISKADYIINFTE